MAESANPPKDGMPSKISLVPTPQDLLNAELPSKYDVEELVTFNTHVDYVQGPKENHPDLRRSLPTFQLPVASRSVDSQAGPAQPEAKKDKQRKQDSPGLRVLALPGQLPHLYAADIKDKVFTVTEHFGIEKPRLVFEDLCRAAIEAGKKNDLQNADLLTDTQTLWALFETIHEKYRKTKVKKNDKGICIAVQIEHATTYIKVLNSYEVDGMALTDATSELKKAQRGHPMIEVGPSNAREPLNAFKRVLSYGWNGIKIIVEDDNQVTLATSGRDASRGRQNVVKDSLMVKDGSV
ncbi:hypothetical protein Hte_007627 [Hypoxylon texense]